MNNEERDFVELFEEQEAEVLCEMATKHLHKRTGREDLFFLPFEPFGAGNCESMYMITLNDEYGLMYIDVADCISDMAYIAERMITKIEEVEENIRERNYEHEETRGTRLKINPVSGLIEIESI